MKRTEPRFCGEKWHTYRHTGLCACHRLGWILDRIAIAAYRGGMTVKLDLNPEVEAGLVAQAQARGLSLEAYLQQVLKERSATSIPANDATANAAKARAFRAFAEGHRPVGSLTDESLRREHLIRDAQ